MNIRAMTAKDRPALLKMIESTPEFNAMDRMVAMEVIDDYLADPQNSGYTTLIAEVNSHFAGYICYGLNTMTKGTWDIYWLAVAPDMQNRSIGGKLMELAEKDIQASGGKLIILEVSSLPINDKTHKFHLKGGYKYIFTIKDFYGPGDDKVMYEKRFP
jgi:ribosomal protein S18 acetylase RimI-like enzyme